MCDAAISTALARFGHETRVTEPAGDHLTSTEHASAANLPAPRVVTDLWAYWVDAIQRQILYLDVMRRRGNQFLEHKAEGKPPVLAFGHDMLIDGRTLECPCNYALRSIVRDEGVQTGAALRPFVVIDPRAGHGPGIGGFKQYSQVGVALRQRQFGRV